MSVPNFVPICPEDDEIFHWRNLKPAKSVGFILWRPWASVLNFIAFQFGPKQWTKRLTLPFKKGRKNKSNLYFLKLFSNSQTSANKSVWLQPDMHEEQQVGWLCGSPPYWVSCRSRLWSYQEGPSCECECTLQVFSAVYTLTLVLETQWPQPTTHLPIPWTSSAKIQVHFLFYTQAAVLNHAFSKHYTQFSTFGTIFFLVFTWSTLSFKMLNLKFLLSTLTLHMGKHILHSRSISN